MEKILKAFAAVGLIRWFCDPTVYQTNPPRPHTHTPCVTNLRHKWQPCIIKWKKVCLDDQSMGCREVPHNKITSWWVSIRLHEVFMRVCVCVCEIEHHCSLHQIDSGQVNHLPIKPLVRVPNGICSCDSPLGACARACARLRLLYKWH